MKEKQYTQRLTVTIASDLMKAVSINAKSLYEDSKILYDNKKFARSISLSILSIEESGKNPIIRSILLETDQKEIAKLWKSFRKHQDKNSMWIAPELIANGARKMSDMTKIVDNSSDHTQVFDDLKQLCFYTDIFNKGKISIPENVGSQQMADRILKIAKSNIQEPLNNVESLIIWVKHLKPVWKLEYPIMKLAVIACYKELEEKNLVEKGMSEKMSIFLS